MGALGTHPAGVPTPGQAGRAGLALLSEHCEASLSTKSSTLFWVWFCFQCVCMCVFSSRLFGLQLNHEPSGRGGVGSFGKACSSSLGAG